MTRPLTFGEKVRSYTADLLKLQGYQILSEKRRRGWTGDYPHGRTRMYLLGPDGIYLAQVVASCVERVWALEVCIVGEGVHFTVDDSVRLMAQPNRVNIIAAEAGMKTYGHYHIQPQPTHTTATATKQGHREVERTIEWWGTDVGGD